MKTKLTLLPLAALLTPAALAAPFTVRPVANGPEAPGFGGYPTGSPIMAPVAADFLGNGLLQWYAGGNTISRFPEAGVVTLPAITLPGTPSATPVPITAAVADVNRDGATDIIRLFEWKGNAFKYTLQVYLNNGAGGFTMGYRTDWVNNPSYNEGIHRLEMVPGDFDGNGSPDIAIVEAFTNADYAANPDHEEGTLKIRWNTAGGNFDTVTTLQGDGITDYSHISAADYDRDGDLDLFCSHYTVYGLDPVIGFPEEKTRSLLFTNMGDRAFSVGDNFPVEMPTQMLDIDNDGYADLANGLKFSLNKKDGTFGPISDQSPKWNYGYFFADTNGNGVPEMVTIDDRVMKSDGNLVATLPAAIAAAGAGDADADGDTDFLVRMENGSFALVENQELHTVPGAVPAGSRQLSGITSLTAADFDMNGREDVAAASYNDKKLWIVPTGQDGKPGEPLFKSTWGENPDNVVAADFDADGRPDLAYTLPLAGEVRLARNTGSSPFLWGDSAIATGLPGVSYLKKGNVGVFSGRPDLFAYQNTNLQLRALNQSGGEWNVSNVLAPGAIAAMAVGQHNSGAGDEVATVNGGNGTRRLAGMQLGFGWTPLTPAPWTEPQSTTAAPPFRLVWADTNGDGSREVAYIDGAGGLSAWNPATMTSETLFPGPADIRDLAAVDWDRDGRTDILAATGKGLTLFHFQRPRGQWIRSDLYNPELNGAYDMVTVLHSDRDGYPDAAAWNRYGRLDLLRNSPNNLMADLSVQPAVVDVAPGSTANVMEFTLTSAARPARDGAPADPNVIVTRCEILLQEAVSNADGSVSPGAPIGSNVLRGAVQTIALRGNGVVIASESGNEVSDTGMYWMDRPLAGSAVPIAPGVQVEHSLRLTLPSVPPQGAPTRFFLTLNGIKGDAHQPNMQSIGSGRPTLLAGNRPVLVNIRAVRTPLQAWREANFGGPNGVGIAANEADPDGDGVPNLVEYVMMRDPKSSGGDAPITLHPPVGGAVPTMELRLATGYDSTVKLSVQGSSDLKNWTTLMTRIGTGEWSKEPDSNTSLEGGRARFIFPAQVGSSSGGKQFFRMTAEQLPQ